MKKKPYILDARFDSVSLIGPFKSIDHLIGYADHPEFNPEDDPRWESTWLTDEEVNSPLKITKVN